jgi:hypothetical protein
MTEQPARASLLKWARDAHRLIGLFIAPSLMLFAFTGFLQLVGLHEAHDAYRPPAFIEKLAQVHIHQKFAPKPSRARSPASKAEPVTKKVEAPPTTPIGVTLLQALFLIVAAGLFLSSALGLWLALSRPQRTASIAVVAAGVVLPVLFVLLSVR